MKKLLIFGDSVLRGITFDSVLGKHRLCENFKFPTLTREGFEIENHARMGATVDRGFELLHANAEKCRDALVMIEYGGNDCDFNWQEVSDCPSAEHSPHTAEKTFVETMKKNIQTVRENGGVPFLSTLVPVDSERYLKVITKGRSYDNILGWLGDVSMLYRYQEHYNRIVEKIARETGTPLVDVREAFLLSHDYANLLSEDGIHPTEKGHDVIENLMLEKLKCYC